MCTYPFAKKALTLYLARSESHERYFGCNLMQCKVLASSHQYLIAEAPVLSTPHVPSDIVSLSLTNPSIERLTHVNDDVLAGVTLGEVEDFCLGAQLAI